MINTGNLLKRCLFALWAVPLGWWAINSTFKVGTNAQYLLPGQLVAIALALIGSGEYFTLVARQYPRNVFWIAQIWLFFQLTMDAFGQSVPLTLSIFVLFILILCEALSLGDKVEGRWKRASLIFSGCIVLYISGNSLLLLFGPSFSGFFAVQSIPMLSQIGAAIVITAVFMCDTAAYFAGNLWGKRRLSRASPNKTVEGTVAGILTALTICLAGWHFFGNHSEYSYIVGFSLGIASGIGAIGGDIMISIVKRYVQVKDSSDLIPGHGGLLDRFGSLFFAAPCVSVVIWIITRLKIGI